MAWYDGTFDRYAARDAPWAMVLHGSATTRKAARRATQHGRPFVELAKNPFDELLLVQAQEEGTHLLTRNAKLVGHPFFVNGEQGKLDVSTLSPDSHAGCNLKPAACRQLASSP